jgi:hypothetical protein
MKQKQKGGEPNEKTDEKLLPNLLEIFELMPKTIHFPRQSLSLIKSIVLGTRQNTGNDNGLGTFKKTVIGSVGSLQASNYVF